MTARIAAPRGANVLAAAQTSSLAGDIAGNVRAHLRIARRAAEHGVRLLVFPELSLTGYELALLSSHRCAPEDEALAPLRVLAQDAGMSMAIGAPVVSACGMGAAIGAIVLHGTGATEIYRKRHLHGGEERFAIAGTRDSQCIDAGGTRVALAICADTAQPAHAAAAAEDAARLYAAGVLWTPAGYDADAEMMRGYAIAHGYPVLMANHGGPSGGYESAGRSAFWAPDGACLACAPETGDALVLAWRESEAWRGAVEPLASAPVG